MASNRQVLKQAARGASAGQADQMTGQVLQGLSNDFGQRRQQLVNDEAIIEGQEDALNNPNEKPTTPITQADRLRNESYLNASTTLNISDAQTKIQAIADDVTTRGNLDATSLKRYRGDANAIVKGYVDNAPPARKAQVQIALNDIYKGADRYVGKTVQKHNEILETLEYERVIKQYTSGAEKAYSQGNIEYGNALVKQAYSAIDNAASMGILYKPEALDKKDQLGSQAQAAKESVRIGSQTAVLKGKLRGAMANGQGEQFLSDFYDNPPKGLSEEQFKSMGAQLYKEFQFVDKLKGKQQQINYNDLSAAIERGEITDLESIESQRGLLSGAQESNLKNKFLGKQAKDGIETQKVYDTWALINNNDLAIANVKPSEINKAMEFALSAQQEAKRNNLIASGAISETDPTPPMSIMEEAYIVSQSPVPVTYFENKLEFVARSGTPAQKVDAAKSYRYMMDNNKQSAINGIDDTTAGYFNMVDQSVKTGMAYDQAVSFVDSQFQVDQNVRTERDFTWKEKTTGSNKMTLDDWREDLADGLSDGSFFGGDASIIPEGAANQYQQLVHSNFVKSGNYDNARQTALDQMSATYGPDIVGGTGNIMYLPPERVIPGYAENPILAKNSFQNSVNDIALYYEESGNASITLTNADSAKNSDALTGFSTVLTGQETPQTQLQNANQGPLQFIEKEQGGAKTYLNVNGVQRQIIPISDSLTAADNGLISYGIGYVGDYGQQEILMSPNGLPLRWVPDDPSKAQDAAKKDPEYIQRKEAAIEKENKARERVALFQKAFQQSEINYFDLSQVENE